MVNSKYINLLESYNGNIISKLEELYNNTKINELMISEIFNYAINNWKNQDKIIKLIMFADDNGFINELLQNTNNHEKIIETVPSLLYLKQIAKNNSIFYNKIINRIKSDLTAFTNQIIDNTVINFHLYIDVDKQKLDTFKSIFYMILEDIAKNENEKIYNLNFVGSGNFSDVLSLGNKIIKIGKKRITPTFQNNPYIIQPLLRKQFVIGDYNTIFVEVTEKAKTDNCTEEDIYYLYKSLRELHLAWLDPKLSNIGKLTKDNIIYWKNTLQISDELLMLEPKNKNICLKAGEPIITDADDIYYETDNKVNFQKVYRYELKYQNEKK